MTRQPRSWERTKTYNTPDTSASYEDLLHRAARAVADSDWHEAQTEEEALRVLERLQQEGLAKEIMKEQGLSVRRKRYPRRQGRTS